MRESRGLECRYAESAAWGAAEMQTARSGYIKYASGPANFRMNSAPTFMLRTHPEAVPPARRL